MINLLHLGDITKIKGANVPLVDIVTGGSPCQDLSCAGKRLGLAGERSGLFMEQIRLIKEMRDECARQIQLRGTDEPIRPRYMVWENVPGAFSSNKGADFQAVLEETAKVAQRDARIPEFEGGRWPTAGCIMGAGWSIAWRVHDAQFWGVPQRRKRIALVADFGGETAPEILFERKGLSGDSEQGEQTRQEVTASVGASANPSSYTLKVRGGREIDSKGHKAGKGALVQTELSGTLGVSQDQTLIQTTSDGNVAGTLDASYYKGCGERQGIERTVVYGISAYESNAMKSSNPNSGVYVADTTRTLDNNGGNPACNQGGMIVLEGNGSRPSHRGDGYAESDTMYTLNGTEHHAVCVGNGQLAQARLSDKVGALNCMHDQQAVLTYKPSVGALCMDDYKGPNRQYVDQDKLQISGSIVRRLTPLECERLQGFPDHWTDIGEWVDTKGKVHKDADSPRYKALGNSIALPFWQWMAEKMVEHLDIEHPTMASLFDGIGGFPLVFSRCGCEPIWASEIEEFPIAVTKKHFPDMS